MKHTKTILTILLLALGSSVYAQQKVAITAKAPEAVTVDEPFTVSYTIPIIVKKPYNLTLTEQKEFEAVFGPSMMTSSGISIVDGKTVMEEKATFTYAFKVRKEGTFSIPRFQLWFNGKEYHSNTVRIQVKPEAKRKDRTAPVIATAISFSSEDVFIRVVTDKQSAYVNQSVQVAVQLYTTQQLVSVDKSTVSGCGKEDAEVVMLEQPSVMQEHYKGKTYNVLTLSSYMLYPTKAGELTIPAGTYELTLRTKAKKNNSRDDFFDSENVHDEVVKVKQPSVTIAVKPLPHDDIPVWNVVVGRYELSSSVDKKSVAIGDTVKLTLRFSGEGYPGFIPVPELESQDFHLAGVHETDSVFPAIDSVRAVKYVTYSLVPKRLGAQRVSVESLMFFDPESELHKPMQNVSHTIMVEDSVAEPRESTSGKPEAADSTAENSARYKKAAVYVSAVLLVMLLVAYVAKLRLNREFRYSKSERREDEGKKPSFLWHFAYIASMALLAGCIIVFL